MAARLVLIPLPMSEGPRFDVSVILPFGDDEEAVGIAVRRTAEHLRGLGLSFEILAIDEDSGDNSHAVLALLRAEVPELRVTHAPGRGKGVDVGAARAQGTLLVVSTPDVASASLASFTSFDAVYQRPAATATTATRAPPMTSCALRNLAPSLISVGNRLTRGIVAVRTAVVVLITLLRGRGRRGRRRGAGRTRSARC